MMRARTPSLDVERIALSDGDWIEVKRELSAGDEQRIAEATRPVFWQDASDGTSKVTANLYAQRVYTCLAYLTDWSLTDHAGKRIPLTKDGILALSGPDLEELHKTVVAHADAVEQEKNATKTAVPAPVVN